MHLKLSSFQRFYYYYFESLFKTMYIIGLFSDRVVLLLRKYSFSKSVHEEKGDLRAH